MPAKPPTAKPSAEDTPATPSQEPRGEPAAPAPAGNPGTMGSRAQEAPERAARGLGWKADPEGVVAQLTSTRSLMGAPARLPANASLEQHVSYVNDQQWTSSCVGQALQQCMNIRLSRMGAPARKFSPLAIYTVARMLDRASTKEPFEDWGSYPHLAVKGIKEFGVPYEQTWPLTDESGRVRDNALNAEPPFDVFKEASAFEVSGVYSIDSEGEGRVRSVMQAIAAGYPVAFGTQVDNAFMDTRGKTPVKPAGRQTLGGHMMLFVGYETLSSGVVIMRGLNSWGTGWGDGGFFNASPEFLMDPRLTSLYAFTVGARTTMSREDQQSAYEERAAKMRRGENPDAKEGAR